jgi:hypothetical protein
MKLQHKSILKNCNMLESNCNFGWLHILKNNYLDIFFVNIAVHIAPTIWQQNR